MQITNQSRLTFRSGGDQYTTSGTLPVLRMFSSYQKEYYNYGTPYYQGVYPDSCALMLEQG